MFSKVMSLIFVLFIASLAALLYDGYAWKGLEAGKIIAFQRFAGGLGLGAAVNPKWGFISFDPRVDGVDETQLFPVPGGYGYSPARGLSVSDIREVEWDNGGSRTLDPPVKNPPAYSDHRGCDNCGMDRNQWARTRHISISFIRLRAISSGINSEAWWFCSAS